MNTSTIGSKQDAQLRMAVARMLNVSTAHIPKRTADALGMQSTSRDTDLRSILCVVDFDAYGWIIYVCLEAITAAQGHPELANLMTLARKQGCEYLKLDCDAVTIAGIPEFSW